MLNLGMATEQERAEIMTQTVFELQANGFKLVTREPTRAVFVHGKNPNHVLHLLLSLISLGFWIPIWLLITLGVKEKNRVVTVDENGDLDWYDRKA